MTIFAIILEGMLHFQWNECDTKDLLSSFIFVFWGMHSSVVRVVWGVLAYRVVFFMFSTEYMT